METIGNYIRDHQIAKPQLIKAFFRAWDFILPLELEENRNQLAVATSFFPYTETLKAYYLEQFQLSWEDDDHELQLSCYLPVMIHWKIEDVSSFFETLDQIPISTKCQSIKWYHQLKELMLHAHCPVDLSLINTWKP